MTDDQRALAAQVLRYAITGGVVTLLGVSAYWLFVRYVGVVPLVANIAAYVTSMAFGYVAHSRFSFRGHGTRDNVAARSSRFVLVSLVSFALNSLFVWVLTGPLHGADWWPIPAMIFVTPAVVFLLNRKWVFA
ncbi:MAG: GtrA family protein [Sphingomonadaceae bacterium]|nr:GtrA family protein [Sphingomonadaceae bacterium]